MLIASTRPVMAAKTRRPRRRRWARGGRRPARAPRRRRAGRAGRPGGRSRSRCGRRPHRQCGGRRPARQYGQPPPRGGQPTQSRAVSSWTWIAIAAGAGVLVVVVVNVVRVLRHPRVARVALPHPGGAPTIDESGAVRSVQAADLILPDRALDAIWTPMHLERLARTYWRFLTRVTLGLIRIAYTERGRFVVLLPRPFVLLRFQAPEYAMDAEHGVVRWRIERGILVAR